MASDKSKIKKIDEERVLELVNPKVQKCVSWYDSKLSKEREKINDYYEGRSPVRQSNGNSSYVAPDVYDGVESMHAQLMETFGGAHHNLLRFKPKGPEDAQMARVATKYVDHVIFEQNDGFGLLYDTIKDGLLSRNAVARAYWESKAVYDENTFEKLTLEEVNGIAAQDDIEDLEGELDEGSSEDPAAATYSGKYRRKIDKSKVVIEGIAPEEFYIDSAIKRREDGTRGFKTLKTKADLVEMGYDKAKINKIYTGDGQSHRNQAPEVQARHASTSDPFTPSTEGAQDELMAVYLHTTYLKMALEKDGTAALYRVVHTDAVVFECDEVDEDEFIVCNLLRRPHVWWGDNYAKRQMQSQNARTALMRGILDHTAITTNPRWQVLKGALTNPREMLDNRLGGLVNVNRQDGLTPLQYPNLNPFVFETLKMVKENNEETRGISSLSQGMNKDAISSQNSEGLVDNLVSLSQVRQRVMARNFARGFLTELYLKVYRLVVENEKARKVFEVAGEFIAVEPKHWISQRDVVLSLHLGYGEQEKEANNLIALSSLVKQDPQLQRAITDEKAYKLATDVYTLKGVSNWADYLAPVEQWPKPEPDPIELAKAQAAKATADAALLNAQAAAKKADVAEQTMMLKDALDHLKHQLDVLVKDREADRKDLDVVARAEMAEREMELAEQVPPEGQRGIFSPNT
jgi:hypothetical protein